MNLPNKIVITGTSGCGKTTLGQKLSLFVGKKCIDLDDLYWLPNWTPRSDEDFFDLIQQELYSDEWIICGNYSRVQEQIWERADMIIWIDMPLYSCLWGALKRSAKRWINREHCCNGNYETVRRIFGRDSILLWIWNTYSRRKRSYVEYFDRHSHHQELVRLQSSGEVQDFVLKFLSKC